MAMSQMSTVGILGPGAVGGVLAVGLAQAGVRVICIARPDTADVIESDGLTLKHLNEVETARPDVTMELAEPVDLLLVTVKAPALDDALDRVNASAKTVVPLLNGIEHMQVLRDRLPDSRVVAGSIGWIEAWLERPGTIVQNTPRVVMTLARDADDATAELLRVSRSEVRVKGGEAAVLWEKLARQAPVAAATAASQRPIGDLRSDPEWRGRLERAITETCAIATADGVPLAAQAQWEIIESMPPKLTSSTARDIAAGRPSELDAITGAAVRAAHRLGVPAPALEDLLAAAEDACRASSR
ncbi:MAG: ketopantoate reductase family protein [Actinobacteria bacterium]|nr:MAG: ketopantoate reductase family protein [Actinomycetota bacterium]